MGFFSLLGRSPESGMRAASLRTGEPRDTVSAHLRTSGRFSCWPARTHLHTHAHARRRVHRRTRFGWWWLSVLERAGRTDALNTTHAGDVSSPHDALPLIKKGKRGEKKWIQGASERWLRSSASHYESLKWDCNPDTTLSFSLAAF